MEAGRLTRRVNIQRQDGTQTAMGNEDPTAWVNVATCWAGFVPQGGRERMTRFQEAGIGMEMIEIRYFAGLTRKDRLSWLDPLTKSVRIFDIQDIQEFPSERKQIVIGLEVT